MKKIVYTRADGGVTVSHPAIGAGEQITEEDALQRAFIPADAINPQVIEADDVPVDRTFRDAWTHDGANITVDMTKAVEIQKDRLRLLRAPMFADLDVAFIQALESGDAIAQADIANQKQALRDVTDDPAIAAATTPEELKAAIPSVLLP